MSKPFGKGTVSLLQNLIDTATILGVERAVIDSHSLRGESQENSTFMLLPFPEDTEHSFGAIGIGRIPVLRSRLKLFKGEGEIIPEFKENDNDDKFVFRLELKKGRTKLDFKCTNPTQIRAPKAFNAPDAFRFTVNAEDIAMMLSSKNAMQANFVTFSSTEDGKVTFSVSADEGDRLTHEMSSTVEALGSDETFTSMYKTKILFPVLKEISDTAKDGDVEVVITKRGIMKIEVNDIPAYIFPEV